MTDPSGAAASGIQVSIHSTATNYLRETITNREGQFLESSLPIGSYRITFRGTSHRTRTRESIQLSAADVVRVDAQMQLGVVSESVEVRREAQPIQTDTPEVGAVFDAQLLKELPLNDLKKFDVPTLIIHGDDDQIVPFAAAGLASSKLIEGSILKVYPKAPHGITDTHKDQLNADLLAFLNADTQQMQKGYAA